MITAFAVRDMKVTTRAIHGTGYRRALSKMVDLRRVELLASAMRMQRSTS